MPKVIFSPSQGYVLRIPGKLEFGEMENAADLSCTVHLSALEALRVAGKKFPDSTMLCGSWSEIEGMAKAMLSGLKS